MRNFRAKDMPGYVELEIPDEWKATEPVLALVEVDPEPEPEPDLDPVPEGSGKEILKWVTGDADRAKKAMAAEVQREEPRSTLMRALAKLVEAKE